MSANALFVINGQAFIKSSMNFRICDTDSISVNINFNTKTYKDL